MNLLLDLSKNATRTCIFDTALANMACADRRAANETRKGTFLEKKHCKNLFEIFSAIEASPLDANVKSDAKAVYRILAEAESTVHGRTVEETHFHEVGNAGALANTLAICQAINLIGPDEVHATPVQIGSGSIICAHGRIDIPAPATRVILDRGNIPIASYRLQGELCTPTSAALILHFVGSFLS